MISRHSPIRLFALTVKRRPFMRAAAQPIHVQRFIALVKSRALGNRMYRIESQSPDGFRATKLPEGWRVVFHAGKERDGRNWATIKVSWPPNDPTLLDLDDIRDTLFGKETYTAVYFNLTQSPCEVTIGHCLDDKFRPAGNGE